VLKGRFKELKVPREEQDHKVLRELRERSKETQEVLALKVLRELKELQHQLVMIYLHIGNLPLERLVPDKFHFQVQTRVV
jgi:hypothetical protein